MPIPDTLPALQAFLLPEQLQQEFVFEENYLQLLIKLTQDIANNTDANFWGKWSLFKNNNDVEPQLLITDFKKIHKDVFSGIMHNHKQNLIYLLQSAAAEQSTSLEQSHYPIIRGIAASAGTVTTKAIVIKSLAPQKEEFPTGAILVVPAIIPSYLPLLKKASAIISEQGGLQVMLLFWLDKLGFMLL